MKYKDFKELLAMQKAETEAFSKGKIFFIFASDKKEFMQKLKSLDLNLNDIIGINGGGYIKKQYYNDFKELLLKQKAEKEAYIKNNIYEVALYYFWDYEAFISLSYSYNDILKDIMFLSESDIKDNREIIKNAINDYERDFIKLNV